MTKGSKTARGARCGITSRAKRGDGPLAVPSRKLARGAPGNDCRFCNRPGRTNDLQITSQSHPWSNVKVVERFELVLGAREAPCFNDQVEIVIENATKIGVGVCDAELVSWTALK